MPIRDEALLNFFRQVRRLAAKLDELESQETDRDGERPS